MNTRICSTCGAEKPVSEFGVNKRSSHKLRRRCNECYTYWIEVNLRWATNNPQKAEEVQARFRASGKARAFRLRSRYGLDEADYQQLLAQQSGVCAICKADKPGGRYRHFHVDHCHTTKRVRGLLCTNCNRAIGYMGDDPDRMKKAAQYLCA